MQPTFRMKKPEPTAEISNATALYAFSLPRLINAVDGASRSGIAVASI